MLRPDFSGPRLFLVSWLVLFSTSTIASPSHKSDEEIVLEDVELQDGVTADIHVTVFVNEKTPCRSPNRTALVVHGYAHSAATWEGFADALFDAVHPSFCRVAAIDLPGAGLTPPPTGIDFSKLSLQDYVTALLAALDRLPGERIRPRTLIGHSQGALVIQLAQKWLSEAGESLSDLGVHNTVLLAPSPPRDLPWYFVDSRSHLGLLESFFDEDDRVVDIPGVRWPTIFFVNFSWEVAPGTPLDDVLDKWATPEPLVSSLELTGGGYPFPVVSRPVVDAGVFADSGVTLQVVGFEQDVLVFPDEVTNIYEHLTGAPADDGLVIIPGSEAVHDSYISQPEQVVNVIAW